MDNTKTSDIKDYLHLYLGQNAKVIFVSEAAEPHLAKLGSVVLIDTITLCLCDTSDDFNVKPILRPLSSMTEEEAEQIAIIAFGQPDSVKWRIEHKKGYLKIYRKHYSRNIVIDHTSGDVDFYDDDGLDTSLQQTEIFRTLLSKGFDIFDLHSKGLCLYPEEIKE